MSWNLTRWPKCRLLVVTLAFIINFVCIDVAKDCDYPGYEILQKSTCTGFVIAVHSVWTEQQCIDKYIRHPRCDRYIFYRKRNENCKLLNTADIPGAQNSSKITGACAPANETALREFLLGTKSCG
ncbi:hypothetical protein OS493_025228 [Desmophyllum pertusum]|uniref:Uncharacterized protein n=1 Tax=Desmophyllum pertusum TaxID=174260 RepID=A0A9W9ZLU9_9CNID|nr:hypothetical protein OS493_025228 [Desmophyllum pertusum]